MAVNWKILAQFVKIPPQAWDYIIPKGPIHGSFTPRLGEHVALNPQPLPPHEAVVGARLLENVLTSAIIIQGGRGGSGDAGRMLMTEIEDWCGTGWPGKWPKPKGLDGWDDSLVFAGAALAAAGLADQYDHNPEMQEALGAAAEQLAGAAGGLR